MTLNKAIEILSDFTYGGVVTFNQDATDAIRLGVEAMKRIIELHEDDELLPGETED